MKLPKVIQFFIQSAEEGGYFAEAIGYSIYTQGETLDETVKNIKEAVACHFDEDETHKFSVPITINFAIPEMV